MNSIIIYLSYFVISILFMLLATIRHGKTKIEEDDKVGIIVFGLTWGLWLSLAVMTFPIWGSIFLCSYLIDKVHKLNKIGEWKPLPISKQNHHNGDTSSEAQHIDGKETEISFDHLHLNNYN